MPESPTLWVVGPPRSGTSAVTRLLTLMGASAGDPDGFLEANPELNPHGYFEQKAILALNDVLLAALGGHVLFPPPVAPGWERSPQLDDHRAAAAALIDETFPPDAARAIKDPRLSITLPFWLPLVAQSRAIICIRDPAEALASQVHALVGQARADHLAWRWVIYTASALVNTAHMTRALIRYHDLISRPAEEVDRVARLLGAPPDQAIRFAAASIEPELRHHREGPGVPEQGRALYDALSAEDGERALEQATDLAHGLLEREREAFDWESHARGLATTLGAALQRERTLKDWIANRERALEWHVQHRAVIEGEVERLRLLNEGR
jgi:hypothetical protein